MKLGEVWTEPDVARAYRYRPEYPPETFQILSDLIVGPRTVLDVGAGTGALARGMVPLVDRVDAVDISRAMIEEGRHLPHGTDPRLRWILGSAEEAPLDPPYGLITAGAAVHWFDEARTMPRPCTWAAWLRRSCLLERPPQTPVRAHGAGVRSRAWTKGNVLMKTGSLPSSPRQRI